MDEPRTARIALALLILVSCLLAASSWRVYSNTWDEPEHLAAGIELLDKGRYEYDTEHPPLQRILMALGPYLAGARSFGTPPPDGVQEGVDILYTGGHYDLYLTLARLGTLPFLALLLFAMWLWARRLTGSEGLGVLGVLLLASVPPILGHAGLATLDIAAAGTVLLALYAAQSWFTSGRWQHAVFFGATAGLAVASKFSAIPFLGLGALALGAVHVALAPRGSFKGVVPWLKGLAIVLVVGLIPLFAVYAPRSSVGSTLVHRYDMMVSFLLQEHGLSHAAGVVLGSVWLPLWFKGFIEGVIALKAHNDTGHLSFLLGQLKTTGWWYFYFVALAVKTPLPLLITSPVGLVMLAREGWKTRDSWRMAPLVLFVTILVFASWFSHINIGIRHILIVYPFMVLGTLHVAVKAWGAARRVLPGSLTVVGSALVVGVMGLQVSTLLTANPDYLPYFNEAVAHPEQILVDSDLDWGQDLWRLETRAAEIKIRELNLAYRGTADLAREKLPPYVVMPPWKPSHGWIAISMLAKVHDPKGYAWLDAYKPMEWVGKTIELYYVP
jgi:4-amino-4-deoxy-L-arabinose transferase-like glycosyltransferase